MRIKEIVVIIILLFVASLCLTEEDDWYRDQGGTGSGNCGPASVAMGISYQTGIKVTAEDIRKVIGKTEPKGSTTFQQLMTTLNKYHVIYTAIDLINLEKVLSIEKSIVLILIYPLKLSKGDINNRIGRPYDFDSDSAHFIIIKGMYEEYFIVNDPAPNGENRMYLKKEIFKSLKTWKGIEIFK